MQKSSAKEGNSPHTTAAFSVYTAPEFKYNAKPYDQSKLLDANIHALPSIKDSLKKSLAAAEAVSQLSANVNYEEATTVSYGSKFL